MDNKENRKALTYLAINEYIENNPKAFLTLTNYLMEVKNDLSLENDAVKRQTVTKTYSYLIRLLFNNAELYNDNSYIHINVKGLARGQLLDVEYVKECILELEQKNLIKVLNEHHGQYEIAVSIPLDLA